MVSEAAPLVSVIIPSYNRRESLLRTLDSLARQTYPSERVEMIVVDDGSTDGTYETVAAAYPAVHLIGQANQGAAAARNAGVAQSRGDYLVFLDDDIVLHERYLEELVAAYEQSKGVLAMGQVQPDDDAPASVWSEVRTRGYRASMLNDTAEVPFTSCVSNNLCVSRASFLGLGGWDNVVGDGPATWADVLFGYQAHQKGYKLIMVPDAILWHHDRWAATLDLARKRAELVGRLAPRLFSHSPELRQHVSMFVDKGPLDWGHDQPVIITRKLLRSLLSLRLVQRVVEWVTALLERTAPDSRLLPHLYNWQISAHIRKGYRQGLKEMQTHV